MKREFDDRTYAEVLQTFIVKAERIQDLDNPELAEIMEMLAGLLRIGCGKLTVYDDIAAERRGIGNEVVFYDGGDAEQKPAYTSRHTIDPGRIVQYAFYTNRGDEEWDEDERERLSILVSLFNIFGWRLVKHELELYHATHEQDYGLYNISYATRKLEEYSNRHILGEFGVCHFNIKRLSVINETFGRDQGTILVRRFLKGLQGLLTDGREIVGRFGGDNFMVIFHKDHMEEVVAYLKGASIIREDAEGEEVLISAWMGIYLLPEKVQIAAEIVDAVAFAVNAAKSRQSDEPIFFNEQMQTRFSEGKRLQFLFADAIKNEEFLIYYQPKVRIKNYTLAGAEALCRWRHDGQMIMPGLFIPVLEQSNRIGKLDFYMLDHVCRDIRRWLDEGRKVVRVSVNLSRRHFGDKHLLERILEIIDRNHVPHKYIEIELTETSTEVEFKELKKLLEGLREQGIHTAVDDFGSGYSSLNLIRELPWDVLKLDKSFIDLEGHDSKKAQMMFSHVIALAHELGMECITEGVETVEQISMLKDNNCYLAQGFYFDRPLPVREFEQRLVRKK